MIAANDEVSDAIVTGAPIVALESTLVAHGLPYPDNLEVACALEDTVRSAGAVPATIAIIDGRPRAGLDLPELERIARGGRDVPKAGIADLAVVMAVGTDAATTVSATSELAVRAGIRVFATGGIGGVHRGNTGDVSSDLATLAQLPIAVVSAGAKAVLDLPRTLEALEALGVLVLGYRTDELPAFYTRRSGVRLEHRIDEPVAIAAIMRQRFDVLDQGGILVANPIPEEAALDPDAIDAAIEAAVAEATRAGLTGKRLTPFLLERLAALTEGRSVAANRALALSNAALAARIAVCYCDSHAETAI